jgi:hypothetical protein
MRQCAEYRFDHSQVKVTVIVYELHIFESAPIFSEQRKLISDNETMENFLRTNFAPLIYIDYKKTFFL